MNKIIENLKNAKEAIQSEIESILAQVPKTEEVSPEIGNEVQRLHNFQGEISRIIRQYGLGGFYPSPE